MGEQGAELIDSFGRRPSDVLNALGWFNALGTMECNVLSHNHGDSAYEEALVRARAPGQMTSNNGVTVVYDENGHPWIKSSERVSEKDRLELSTFKFEKNGYVPHSNDGGFFVRRLLPLVLPSAGPRSAELRLEAKRQSDKLMAEAEALEREGN